MPTVEEPEIALSGVDLSDSDDGFEYRVIEDDDISDDGDDSDEDLTAALASLSNQKREAYDQDRSGDGSQNHEEGTEKSRSPEVVTQVRPAVAEDFIRNFLIKVGMTRTLDTFNTEWYEMRAKGHLGEQHAAKVPDIYFRNEELDEQVLTLREQLDKMEQIATKAQGTWDKFRKERDFHRMHHKRVVQEKQKLVTDLKRLKKHFKAYEPTLNELQRKYQVAMKERMLTKLERDRLKAKLAGLEAQLAASEGEPQRPSRGRKHPSENGGDTAPPSPSSHPAGMATGSVGLGASKQESKLPADGSVSNPFSELSFSPPAVERFSLRKTHKAHMNSVAAVAFHPRKSIIATGSDDETWKIWSVPDCELIMSGEGHRNWIASVAFHPQGTCLATGSGDSTVKIWDFQRASCAATFEDHTQAVWDVAFHHTGDFVASCSMDHTTRLWDLQTGRCRQTLRGHVDSVNSVCWKPYSNCIATGSGDKTLSLWDARSGLCIQTFYGHMNAVNHVVVSARGDSLASCDADGVVKVWDVRMVAERGSIEVSRHPVNRISFDRSGTRLATAGDDGTIRVLSILEAGPAKEGEEPGLALLSELSGHEEAVQNVVFSPADDSLISCGSDCTFRVWS